jgi:uncharacterized protein YecE (DUF72 family)
MRGRLLIGTSGYAYPHWRRRFYPADLPAREWLPFYARRFPSVELNNPFYRLPGKRAFRAWRAAVPADFVFAVKASRYLTHLKRLRAPTPPLDRLLRRLRPLGPTLGPVLFQLPPQFHADVPRLRRFLDVLGRQQHLPGLRAALEVRHASWLDPEVLDLLCKARVALCLHDSRPQTVSGPVTADFVYLRRHGTSAGYRGSYSRTSLAADARRIRRWRRDGLDVYVYFNNDGGGAAVRDAWRLATLLGARL